MNQVKGRAGTKPTLERGSDGRKGRQRGKIADNASRPLVILWREAVRDHPEVTTLGTCVLHTLSTYMSAYGEGWPGLTKLSKGCKLNKYTGPDIVSRELKKAAELGLLTITPRDGATSIYQAVLPTCPQQGGVVGENPPALNRQPTYPEQVGGTYSGQVRSRHEVEKQIEKEVEEASDEELNDSESDVEVVRESENPATPSHSSSFPSKAKSSDGDSELTTPRPACGFYRLWVTYQNQQASFSWPIETALTLSEQLKASGAKVQREPNVYDHALPSVGAVVA